MMMYAFVGFESATIVSGESKDPRRSLPALARSRPCSWASSTFVVLSYVAVLPELEGNSAWPAPFGLVGAM